MKGKAIFRDFTLGTLAVLSLALAPPAWSNSLDVVYQDQARPNVVPYGQSVTFSLRNYNVDDFSEESDGISTGIGIWVDGIQIAANSGVFSSSGCSVDTGFTDFWACGSLLAGGSELISFTWLSPDPGTSTVEFRGYCQEWPVPSGGTRYCNVNGASWGSVVATVSTIAGNATDITGCSVISASGTYDLIADIVDTTATNCIEITASDVTLNGNNHLVDGTDAPGTHGVHVSGASTLTNVNINNVRVFDFESGIYLDGVDTSTVQDCILRDNTESGIEITDSDNNTVDNCELRANNYFGAILLAGSEMNTITGNTVTGQGQGIQCGQFSSFAHNNDFTNNYIAGNQLGIDIAGCDGIEISDNELERNYTGIYMSGSTGSTVTRNTVTHDYSDTQDYVCIELSASINNLIYDNYFNCQTENVKIAGGGYATWPNDWSIPQELGTNIVGGPYQCGNYWDDFRGFGSGISVDCSSDVEPDYICDDGFTIDPYNEDPCPLLDFTAASLVIVKRIVNDNGGTATVGAFGINTGAGTPSFGGGVADGANTLKYTSSALSVNANTPYSLSENNIAGYTEGTWSCVGGDNLGGGVYNSGTVTVAPGGSKTCTITNNDSAASLIIVKRIINDNGGTATVGAFGINTGAGTPSFGGGVADGANTLKYTSSALSVNANTPYSLTENNIAGYTEGSWACVGGDNLGGGAYNSGSVTLGPGVTKTCTITNNDSAASLIIVKRIINDNDGTATVGAFGINTDAGTPSFGGGVADGANTLKYTSSALSVNANTPYSLTENNIAGYTEGSWACVGGDNLGGGVYNSGTVTLAVGVTKTCTITNNDNPPAQLTLRKVVDNSGGGTLKANEWTLSATGSGGFNGQPTGTTLDESLAPAAVTPGVTYTLNESGPSGYSPSAWSCTGGSQSGSQIILNSGDNVTCTITNTFTATAPNAPTDLSVDTNQFLPLKMHLEWLDNSDNETQFVTERGLCGDNDTCFEPVLITKTPDPTTMGLTTGTSDGCLAEPSRLAQNVTYYFRVKAMNDAGSSDWSSVVSAVTGIGSDNCGSSTTTNGSIATQIYPPPPPSATVEGATGAPLSFAQPRATALDRQGRVIVADTDHHRIQICAAGSCASFGSVGAGVGQFNRPQGVAVDHQDRIWVADTDNDRLQRCTDVGVCTVMGSAGSAPGQFLSPHGIAVDGHGRILVADTDNDRIQRCQAFGSCAVIDSSLGPFNAPQGVTAAADGHIWVADTGNDRIQGCTAQGACTSFGTLGSELGQFDTPTRMGMDSDDRMVIADTGNARVVMCSTEGICQDLGREYMEPSGVDIDDRGQVAVADASLEVVELLCLVTVEDVFGGEGTTDGSFNAPQGVASDSTGRTILADTANHRIRVCSGNNCSSFGGLGTNLGAFHAPAGVAVDATDRIIVADTLNDRIQVCSDSGTCTAFGTTGTAAGQFDTPTGVAIDSTGRIVVADSLNNRIQVCTDTGTCSAFGTLGSATGQFDLPWGVAVDGSDQIIVTDNNNNRIQVCTDSGTCTAFGSSGSKLGEFQLPRGVAIDSKDRILISDWGNDRIQVCAAHGDCSAFGQTGTDTGEFTRPSGVAVDTHDRIIVADTDNHRLQTLQRCAPTERVFSGGFEE